MRQPRTPSSIPAVIRARAAARTGRDGRAPTGPSASAPRRRRSAPSGRDVDEQPHRRERIGRHPAEARLQAEDAGERDGNADRAGAVAAEMQRRRCRRRRPRRRRRCCRPGCATRSHGLRVMPVNGLSPIAFQPNSGSSSCRGSRRPPRAAAPRRRVLRPSPASGSTRREPRRVGKPAHQHQILDRRPARRRAAPGSPRCQRCSEAPRRPARRRDRRRKRR